MEELVLVCEEGEVVVGAGLGKTIEEASGEGQEEGEGEGRRDHTFTMLHLCHQKIAISAMMPSSALRLGSVTNTKDARELHNLLPDPTLIYSACLIHISGSAQQECHFHSPFVPFTRISHPYLLTQRTNLLTTL